MTSPSPDLPTLTAVAGVLLGGYGAILSTYNLVRAWRQDTKRVKVTMRLAFYASTGPRPHAGPTLFSLEVVNVGPRTVTVSAPMIRIGREKLVPFRADGFSDFPKELTDGASGTVRVPVREIAEAIANKGLTGRVTIRPTCSETTGRTYLGKRMKFDVGATLASVDLGPIS